jgi:hypothetical protein
MTELIRGPRGRLALLGTLILLAGCATLSPQPAPSGWGAAKVAPPSPRIPPAAPLSQGTTRPFTLGSPAPQPSGSTANSLPPTLAGPALPSQANSRPRLELTVDAPRLKQAGSGAEYHLSVHNPGISVARNVTIECRFDELLIFPGKEDKRAIQKLGNLAAGETRQVDLTLASDDVGRHCCDFAVLSEGHESVWKSVCVEFVPRQLEVTLVGPAQRAVGSRAEFNLRIVNVSTKALDDVEARLTYGDNLKAEEATADAAHKPGSLSWQLGTLKPGEGVQLQAEFTCLQAAEHACVSAIVTGPELPEEKVDACLSVSEPAAGLEMRVLDRADPIDVGDETGYVVIVQNRSGQPAREVRLRADLPDNFRIVAVEVQADNHPFKLEHQFDGRQLSFEPVHLLNPGSYLNYLIQVKALRAGDIEFRADLSSSLGEQSTTAAEPTTVNP